MRLRIVEENELSRDEVYHALEDCGYEVTGNPKGLYVPWSKMYDHPDSEIAYEVFVFPNVGKNYAEITEWIGEEEGESLPNFSGIRELKTAQDVRDFDNWCKMIVPNNK